MLVRALIVLVSTAALLSPPGASAAPSVPAAPAPAAAGDRYVVTGTCSDGGRIRMRVDRSSADEVRVDLLVSGIQDDGRWEGGIVAGGDEDDPMGGDYADFRRRPVDGAWHAAATLTAGRDVFLHSTWVRRGRHICSVGTTQRTPLFGISFCNGNDFGLDYLIRRVDRPGIYRVKLLGGTDWAAGTRWRLSISSLGEHSTLIVKDVVRADRRGHFSLVAELPLDDGDRVVVRAAGPESNTCTLGLRRTW